MKIKLRKTVERVKESISRQIVLQQNKNRIPKFMIIGFPKSGTQSLVRNLNQHPDVFVPTEEPWFFFLNPKNRTLKQYLHLFEPDKTNGDKSPGYIFEEEAMVKIKQFFPDTKLIICLRHPIQFLHSFYHHRVMDGEVRGFPPGVRRPFEEIVLNDLDIMRICNLNGCFYNFIKNNVLNYFDKSQVKIIIQERMWEQTNQTLQEIFHFIGVSPHNLATNRTASYNTNFQYHSIDYQSDSYKKAIEKLFKLYKPWNEQLFKYLGGEIKEWRKFDELYKGYIS